MVTKFELDTNWSSDPNYVTVPQVCLFPLTVENVYQLDFLVFSMVNQLMQFELVINLSAVPIQFFN